MHTIFYFTQAAEISTKSSLPQSVFHSLDVAYAAWGSDERTVPHKCGSVSEETRIKDLVSFVPVFYGPAFGLAL